MVLSAFTGILSLFIFKDFLHLNSVFYSFLNKTDYLSAHSLFTFSLSPPSSSADCGHVTVSVKPILHWHNLCEPITSLLSKFKTACLRLCCCQLSFQSHRCDPPHSPLVPRGPSIVLIRSPAPHHIHSDLQPLLFTPSWHHYQQPVQGSSGKPPDNSRREISALIRVCSEGEKNCWPWKQWKEDFGEVLTWTKSNVLCGGGRVWRLLSGKGVDESPWDAEGSGHCWAVLADMPLQCHVECVLQLSGHHTAQPPWENLFQRAGKVSNQLSKIRSRRGNADSLLVAEPWTSSLPLQGY